jgi:hypothetical protein
VRTESLHSDEQLLAALQAPPDLGDGVQSLAYWRERRRRLAWYRVRARREATQMALRWEQRVAAALLSQPGVSLSTRFSAGVLLGRVRLRRWGTRAAVATAAIVGMALLATPMIALYMLVHAV